MARGFAWKLLLVALIAATLFGLRSTAVAEEPSSTPADEAGFVALFDGKSLAGWEGNEKVFRVEKGAIVAGSLTEAIPQNEFLCTTKEYGDFELRLQAKLEGKGENAGIQFRSQRVPNHHEVSGYQCDMGRAWDRSVWGALYDESRRNKILAEPSEEVAKKASREPGEWNDFVIRCEGPTVQIWLNGVQTVDYGEKDGGISRAGVIGLQIHGGEPAQASYRNIRIKTLGGTEASSAK
jgi:hypothetical protein